MVVLTQRSNDEWSEWKWRFAFLPALAGIKENGEKLWIWLGWYERRSKYGGAYLEYRSPRAASSAVMDMSY